jgi:hypothetical protein
VWGEARLNGRGAPEADRTGLAYAWVPGDTPAADHGTEAASPGSAHVKS